MAQSNKPAKTMSSRLMDMKFMQRAAASAPSSTPSTPPEPSSKRQRLSNGTYNATASSQASDDQAGNEIVINERQKREKPVEFEGADRGDTKWYLSFKQTTSTPVKTPLRIVSAGFGALDAAQPPSGRSDKEDDIDGPPNVQGRRSFGKFNRKVEKQQKSGNAASSSSDSESSENEDNGENDNDSDNDSDDPTGAKAMIAQSRKEAGDKARAERKAKRKAAKAESARLAEDRRKKKLKLNELTSISGRSSTNQDGRCYRCGKKGHMARECPKPS